MLSHHALPQKVVAIARPGDRHRRQDLALLAQPFGGSRGLAAALRDGDVGGPSSVAA